ncbi:hypothetical protein WJX73_009552 [Symbiochloris irregularis]|uniref:Signal peptide peptidase n=1 Tax=Symbiochloris irregularis TaxID=706552 RepID=A0AAW1NWS4_9CHLO
MSQLVLPRIGCKLCCQTLSPRASVEYATWKATGFVTRQTPTARAPLCLPADSNLIRTLVASRRCFKSQALKRQTNSAEATATDTPWETTNQALLVLAGFVGVLVLGQVLADYKLPFVDLPYFVSLASLTIYIAAHKSRSNKTRQQISLTQATLAPVGASGALLGGYLVIKYFQQAPLQLIFNGYFWLLGSVAVAGTLQPPLNRLVAAAGAEASADVLAGHTNFTLNNLLACLIAIDILGLIGLSSFRTALVLLLGLLFYDVFWVFGSPKVIGDNVMLTVATSNILTGPVRLLFPRAVGAGEARNFPFALLGLGDIAVPGLLAGLALRFDAARREVEVPADLPEPPLLQRLQQQLKALTGPPAVPDPPALAEESDSSDIYFWACMGAYLAGLFAAFAASTITRMGQPALLYIVPFMLAAVGGVAATQGELGKVLDYKEAPAESPFSALTKSDD